MAKLTELTNITTSGVSSNTVQYLVDTDRTPSDQSVGYDFDSPTGTGATITMSKYGGYFNISAPTTDTTFTLGGDTTSVNSYVVTRTQGAATQPITSPVSTQEGGVAWNNTDEFEMLIWRDSEGLKHQFNAVSVGASGGGSATFEYQTAITTNTAYNSGSTSINEVIPVTADLDVTINKGTWAAGETLFFEIRDVDNFEVLAGTDARIYGVRNIDNEHKSSDRNTLIGIHCRGLNGSIIEYVCYGAKETGYTGAVTTSSYGTLKEGDTGISVTVIGTGFSSNMEDPVLSANATNTGWTYVSNTEITLTGVTAVGVENDTVTVTYRNPDETVDTDAITIAAADSFLFDTNPFEVGFALFKLNSTQTYALTVRRSSDNAETDVGFQSSNNKVGLTSPVSAGGDLTTWAGSDNVFITKRWNQGSDGTSEDIVNATAAEQPQLMSAGAMLNVGTVDWVEYDGTDDVLQSATATAWGNSDITIFANVRVKTDQNGTIAAAYGGSTNRPFYLRYAAGSNKLNWITSDAGGTTVTTEPTATASLDTNYTVMAYRSATEQGISQDGATAVTATPPASSETETSNLEQGDISTLGTQLLDGYNNYLVIYTSDESSNQTSIESILAAGL